jgi:hypothetical protein
LPDILPVLPSTGTGCHDCARERTPQLEAVLRSRLGDPAVLASGAVAAALDGARAKIRPLGRFALRGLSQPTELVEILVPDVSGEARMPNAERLDDD